MIPAQTPETVTLAFNLPLWVPLPKDLRWITTLPTQRVRGYPRRVLVDYLWLSDSQFAWVGGCIVRKVDGDVGTYRSEGWLELGDIPTEVRAHILDLILDGVTTE